MILRFQYTLDEWIELNRQAECGRVLATLIHIAEAAYLPLALGLGSIALLIVLKYFVVNVPIFGALPAWFIFIPLIAFAVTQVYLAAFAGLRKNELTKTWEKHGSRLRYSIKFSEDGIVLDSEMLDSMVSWNQYKEVFRTRRFYMMRRQEDSLYIPKRILERDNNRDEFLDLLYKKIVIEGQAKVP